MVALDSSMLPYILQIWQIADRSRYCIWVFTLYCLMYSLDSENTEEGLWENIKHFFFHYDTLFCWFAVWHHFTSWVPLHQDTDMKLLVSLLTRVVNLIYSCPVNPQNTCICWMICFMLPDLFSTFTIITFSRSTIYFAVKSGMCCVTVWFPWLILTSLQGNTTILRENLAFFFSITYF